MNTGVQDSAQLAWKLAYAIQHKVKDPEALLNSYEEERRHIAAGVVSATGSATKVATSSSSLLEPIVRFMGNLQSILPDKVKGPLLRNFSMISLNYHDICHSGQSQITLEEFFKSPLEATTEILGMKLSSGSRVPHGNLLSLSSPDDQPKTIYSILQQHYTQMQIFMVSTETQKVRELIDHVHDNYKGFISVRVICPSKTAAEELKDKTHISNEQLYYDSDGLTVAHFHGWDIILIRPDCYVEYLGRPTEPLSSFFTYLSKKYTQQ